MPEDVLQDCDLSLQEPLYSWSCSLPYINLLISASQPQACYKLAYSKLQVYCKLKMYQCIWDGDTASFLSGPNVLRVCLSYLCPFWHEPVSSSTVWLLAWLGGVRAGCWAHVGGEYPGGGVWWYANDLPGLAAHPTLNWTLENDGNKCKNIITKMNDWLPSK